MFGEAARSGSGIWQALTTLVCSDQISAALRMKLRQFVDLVVDWQQALIQGLGPHQLATRIVEESGYRKYLELQDNAEGDARLGNIEELLGSIAEFEDDVAQADEAPTLSAYLERISLVTAPDTFKDVAKVALMTVHAAKGLEFDTVLLTGMEDDVFPYKGLDGDAPDELDEERRLAYVAVTRAQNHLFISHASQRTLFGQTRYLRQSMFLDMLPAHAVRHEAYAEELRRPKEIPIGPRRVVDRDAFDDLPPPVAQPSMRPGQPVFHTRFGKGVVETVEPDDGAKIVIAVFPGYGRRKILSRYLVSDP
jgi:DNA helicase-2/ATP-dependent DNA helicase PcrA